MKRYALVENGLVRRVSLTLPHPTALPVEFPALSVTTSTHHITLNPAKQWEIHPNKVVATYTVSKRDLEAEAAEAERQKQSDLAALSAYRYEVETGGLTLPDGTRVLTDRESQAQLSSAYQSLAQPFVEAIDWKADGGWVTVTESELRPIAEAVARHVQACFTAERRIETKIQADESVDYRMDFDDELAAILEA